MTIYLIVTTAILVAILGVFIWNLFQFRTLRTTKASSRQDTQTTKVSVLVPARNEERCIEACITTLCEQHYGNYEVIVLDDESTDATPDILRALSSTYPQLKIVHGTPLPSGWVGKPWACHQLSQQATGDVLIFTDADTLHQPLMIAAAVEEITSGRCDVFTMVPFEVMKTFAENAVIPVIHYMYMCYIPTNLILNSKSVSVSAANGQFICFTRRSYEKCDGHIPVKNSLVEDVQLAKHIKSIGLRIALLDGKELVSCRMYTSARDVTEGFSKNFFPATGYNLGIVTLFVSHLLALYVAPFVLLLFVRDPLLIGLLLLQTVIPALIRLAISIRFQMAWWHCFIQPISMLWTAYIVVNSVRWAYSKQGSLWKGRTYKQI